MSTAPLAAEILRDMLAEASERPSELAVGCPAKCFLCHAGFIYRGAVEDNSGRFCSSRCRNAYALHGLRYQPARLRYRDGAGRLMAATATGFTIICLGCAKPF
jgi:hypothetical protein